MKALNISGKAWVIDDSNQQLIDNIDTDMIFHNSYLHITELNEMGKYAFDNLDGWKDFSNRAKPGDIIIAGKNFGAGSSRQQAVDCFRALGIPLVVAQSFGAIYKRNAINSGLAIIETGEISSDELKILAGKNISVDMLSGVISSNGMQLQVKPMSNVQKEIYLAGNLFNYGRTLTNL